MSRHDPYTDQQFGRLLEDIFHNGAESVVENRLVATVKSLKERLTRANCKTQDLKNDLDFVKAVADRQVPDEDTRSLLLEEMKTIVERIERREREDQALAETP